MTQLLSAGEAERQKSGEAVTWGVRLKLDQAQSKDLGKLHMGL
jgi:hypothetical protein